MKTRSLVLVAILLILSSLSFGQITNGISVQGIARDAEKAALGNELLTFYFEIQDAATSTLQYKESVDIRTDAYGVFSHIIGTGTKLSGGVSFNDVPFSQAHMKLIISVSYRGNTIKLSDGPLQYAPYAKSADNGVPTGAIMPFIGEANKVPAGWVLCDGRDISAVASSQNLRTLLGSNNVPNLQGMFLRGTGQSPVNGQQGPKIREAQGDAFKSHSISGSTSSNGTHNHNTKIDTGGGGDYGGGNNMLHNVGTIDNAIANDFAETDYQGNHNHTVTGSSVGGANETRPVNYGVNYIIKL